MGCAMAGEGWNLLLEEKGDTSKDYGRDEGMNPDGLTRNSNYTSATRDKIMESKILFSATHRLETKQPQRLFYIIKMRLGARENADSGILLAATTEHFDNIEKSLGRLFVHHVSCADNQNYFSARSSSPISTTFPAPIVIRRSCPFT